MNDPGSKWTGYVSCIRTRNKHKILQGYPPGEDKAEDFRITDLLSHRIQKININNISDGSFR
jgi:hypothetical protein